MATDLFNSYSPEDFDKAVRTVWGEARGEPPLGQQAVAAVILNRARSAKMSPTDVVMAKNQFEPWSRNRAALEGLDANSPEYRKIASAIWPVWTGESADPTGGATHFYSPTAQRALGRQAPSWDNGAGVDLGTHRFFKLGYGAPTKTSGDVSPPYSPIPSPPPSLSAIPPSLASSLAAGGSRPMAYSDDYNLQPWTSEEVIASKRRIGAETRGRQQKPVGWGSIFGNIANIISGHAYENEGNRLTTSNQDITRSTLRRAREAKDFDTLSSVLTESPNQELAARGLGYRADAYKAEAERAAAIKQMEEKAKLEQRIQWDNFNRFMAMRHGGVAAGAPGGAPAGAAPAGGGAPTVPAPGAVGTTTVALPPAVSADLTPPPAAPPAVGAGQPGRGGGPLFDDFTIGAGLNTGVIKKDAAEYFAKDPQKKFNEAYDAAAGKRSEESLGDIQKGGVAARQQLQNWQVLRDLVNNPALLQGPMAKQFSVPLRRMAEFFGVKTDGLKETAIFESLINEMALQGRNPAGGAGMPGSMSDKDLAFLQSIVPALGNTREANALLIDIRMRMLKRQAEVAELARRYKANKDGRFDPDGFEDALKQWADANPLFSDAERAQLMGQHGVTPPAAGGTGQTAAAPAAAAPPATPEAQAAVQAELAKKMAGAKKGDTITVPAQGDKPAQKKVFDGTTWQDAGVIDSIKEGIDTKGAAKITDDVVGWLTRQLPDFSGSKANAAGVKGSLQDPIIYRPGMSWRHVKPGQFLRMEDGAIHEIITKRDGTPGTRPAQAPAL
jgi:hypothetical protein